MERSFSIRGPIRASTDVVVGFKEKTPEVIARVLRGIDTGERTLIVIVPGDGVPCGTGKTTFARHLGVELGDIFPGRKFEINLGEGKGAIHAAEAKMWICRSDDEDSVDFKLDDRYDALFENGGPFANGVILIDNAKDAAHAAPLIPRKGLPCCVIVTSRNNLDDLNALGFEISVSLTAGVLSEAHSVELLRLLLNRDPPGDNNKAANEEEEQQLRGLAKLTGGIPLAMLFVGTLARFRWMPFDEMVRRLKGDDSMTRCLCAIYDRLDKPLQRCLRRAAGFSAPFTVEDFESAFPDGNIDSELYDLDAKRFLGHRFELYKLAAKNFLDIRDGTFSLHSVVRMILPREITLLSICDSYIRTHLADGLRFDLSVLPEEMRNKVTCT